MLERDVYPPGVPCWVDTEQRDPEAATDFYGGLFGWEFQDRMPPGSPGRYLVATLRGSDVAGVAQLAEGASSTSAWNMYISVASADEAAARAKEAGGSVVMEPFDVLDDGRMAVLADPAGAVFCVWQPRNHHGAQLVNEPGTWNFSELNTPDPEGAKAFYGALFGWEVSPLDMDTVGSGFWRLAGYGDFLEQRDPGLRQRMAEAGAPERFEDAVAWLMASDRDAGDSPPHWSVTFAVDDTDAVADRAAKLGGRSSCLRSMPRGFGWRCSAIPRARCSPRASSPGAGNGRGEARLDW